MRRNPFFPFFPSFRPGRPEKPRRPAPPQGPVAPGRESAPAAPQGAGLPARASGPGIPRILLLEDEDAVRAALAEALGRSGYLVLAGDGPEAGRRVLSAVGWERIDLVITDAHLGRDPAVRRGHAFHAHWRERHPVPPFIFLSGWGDPAPPPETSCRVYGLAKPFPFAALLALIRAILTR